LMVIVTTFITPPLLKLLLTDVSQGSRPEDLEGLRDLVTTS